MWISLAMLDTGLFLPYLCGGMFEDSGGIFGDLDELILRSCRGKVIYFYTTILNVRINSWETFLFQFPEFSYGSISLPIRDMVGATGSRHDYHCTVDASFKLTLQITPTIFKVLNFLYMSNSISINLVLIEKSSEPQEGTDVQLTIHWM